MMSGADLALRIKFDGSAVAPGLNRMKEDIRSTAAGVSSIFRSMVAPLTAGLGSAAGLSELVTVTREFDKLSAGLITATGSADGAKESFAALQNFAATTPYDLAQTTESFTKLVNFGLTPSERAMRSYGNTASSLGKDLDQMIEAVADAATGEFERLKEFGIKASKEGDKVKFTFRGVKTEVGNNAKEIENYLIKLGENNFGDAMANRMASLDGAISNIGDSWDTLLRTVSGKGIGNAIADGVRGGTAALDELTAKIASGEMDGYLEASAIAWAGWGSDIEKTISLVGQYFDGQMDLMNKKGTGTVFSLTDAFIHMPANIKAAIQIATVGIASFWDRLVLDAKTAGKEFIAGIKGDEEELARLQTERANSNEKKAIEAARDATFDDILKERQATIDSTNAQIEAAKKLREEYDKKQKAAKEDPADKLEKYKFKADEEAGGEEKKKAKDFTPKAGVEFVEKDGQWVPGSTGEQPQPGTDEEKAKQQKEYKKQLAEKRKELTAEEFKERQEYWKNLEEDRTLTKEEQKQKKAEEAKFKREEAERNKLAKKEEQAAKKAAAEAKQEAVEEEKKPAEDDDQQLADPEDSDDQTRDRQDTADEQKRSAGQVVQEVKKAAAEIEQVNAKRIEAMKAGATDWAQTETKAIAKAGSAYQQYANKLQQLETSLAERRKTLNAELIDADPTASEETKWRKKAKAAKEYEQAALAAAKAGRMDEALAMSDKARQAYSGLKGGAGNITEERADRMAYSGIKSSGELGLALSKMMASDLGKQIKVDLGPAGSQLAAAAQQTAQGGGGKTAGASGGTKASRVVELRFPGGTLHGDEASAEAFLWKMEQAGISA